MPDDHGITGIAMSVNNGETVSIDITDLDAVVDALNEAHDRNTHHGAPIGEITIDGGRLCQALNAVIPHAGGEDGLEWLRIDAAGDTVTVYATDRYTIGMARIDGDAIIESDHDVWTIDILADDAKLIAAIFKPGKDQVLNIRLRATTTDCTVTDVSGFVHGRELSISATDGDSALNAIPRLVSTAALAADQSVITSAQAALWVTNAYQWAKFVKSAQNYKGNPIAIEAHEPGKAFLVTIGERFIGLLMPVRTDASDDRKHRDVVGEWIDLLSAAERAAA